MVGFAAVAISGIIGMVVGLVSGYFGRRVDDVFMRLADIQLAFPFILLAIAVIGVLGPSLPVIIVVIGVSSWVVYARVVRGAVLSLREREFVQAAQALGSRDGRILLRHILPNAFTPWLVVATLDMARVIVIESALSFLALGVQPPTAHEHHDRGGGRGAPERAGGHARPGVDRDRDGPTCRREPQDGDRRAVKGRAPASAGHDEGDRGTRAVDPDVRRAAGPGGQERLMPLVEGRPGQADPEREPACGRRG